MALGDNTKAVGDLTKVKIAELDTQQALDLEALIEQAIEEEWLPEEIIETWSENEKDIILLQIDKIKNDFNLLNAEKDYWDFKIADEEIILIPIKILDQIKADNLKNAAELSGVGKILIPFSLTFRDYNKDFLKDPSADFFNIQEKEFIINNIRLVLENNHGLNPSKLTGRAAELARKKGLL